MDIIDIMLAKAITPQQLASYMSQARQASSTAATAAANIAAITDQTNTNNAAAEAALEAANAALDNTIGAADDEIDKIALSVANTTSNNAVTTTLTATYPSGNTEVVNNIAKYYTITGNNADGAMTQLAITELFDSYDETLDSINQDISDMQDDIDYLKEHSGGGSSSLPSFDDVDPGTIIIVGADNKIAAGSITEDDIFKALIKTGDFYPNNVLGLLVDYKNRSYTRINTFGNFDDAKPFGGRMRCNVADNGAITAFYGDNNYTEDGSNGQVMVYQPKFYYSRVPLEYENLYTGNVIRKEIIMLSEAPITGFNVHPLFIQNNKELDYVLLSAYEGSAYTDQYDLYDSANIDFSSAKLSSIAGAKPISGVNKQLTIANAEQMAQNRGSIWHITTMQVESAQQMLQLVEYGTLNSQAALEQGICYITNNVTKNCASITGSTSSLGNETGAAQSTVNETNGSYTTYDTEGRRAISYRGFENPWGNIWRMVANANVSGEGRQAGGILYLCKDYNYSNSIGNNYVSIGFSLPSNSDWISGFGLPAEGFDWVFLPAECSGANSAVPVGDNLWVTQNLARTNMVCAGGQWHFELNDGMFYYCCDQATDTYARSYSARLMCIPTDATVNAQNKASWERAYERRA